MRTGFADWQRVASLAARAVFPLRHQWGVSREDIVQAAIIRMWQAGETSANLYTVAHRAGVDELRRMFGDARAVGRGKPPPDAYAYEERDTAVVDGSWQPVVEMLSALNPLHAKAIMLVKMMGYSYAEVAKMFGKPVGTIHSWVWNGLRALRQQVVDEAK